MVSQMETKLFIHDPSFPSSRITNEGEAFAVLYEAAEVFAFNSSKEAEENLSWAVERAAEVLSVAVEDLRRLAKGAVGQAKLRRHLAS